MESKEGWVGIADVDAHLSVDKDSIYHSVGTKDSPRSPGGTPPSFPAFGGG